MNIIDWVVAIYSVLFCLIWYSMLLQAVHAFFSVPFFEYEDPPKPEKWPLLSVVIVARNEAETIEPALSTLLEQDYPFLELVIVNDRYRDATGAIIEKIAEQDRRIRTVHIKSLPGGWLGKVHALHVGTQKTSGKWLLFTDADIHFKQGTLQKAIAFAMAKKSDHLALLPKINTHSFWLEVVVRAFKGFFLLGTKVAHVGKPDSDAFIGVGAFNLVRKSAFDKTEGFTWLRMEVVDDVGLGYMMNHSGAKCSCAFALQHVSVTWYTSIRAMFIDLEKNSFRLFNYNLIKMFFTIFLIWGIAFAPPVSILYFKGSYFQLFGITAYLVLFIEIVISKVKLRESILPSLFIQIGQIMLSLIILRAGILCVFRKGIIWRERKYPIDELRKGQRFKL